MRISLQKNFLLFAPLILVMILDLIFTLYGQPESYWRDHSLFNESSPLGIFFLSQSPLYFLLFYLVYFIFVLFLISKVKRPFNLMLYIGFFMGHVWGSSSWIGHVFYKIFDYEIDFWSIKIAYFVIVAIISGFAINKWLDKLEKIKNT